ncbi:MAG TPA: hypothetical protein PLA50_00890 [Bacteroidia bacterium]|nr:hypothetical protein [Bacteroidia bacterium]
MSRNEERDPAVIALAQAVDRHRAELGLSPWQALVGIKLATERLIDEAAAPVAMLDALHRMLDEAGHARHPEPFAPRIEPYPIEQWKLSRTKP